MKLTRSPDEQAFSRNDGSYSAPSRNDSSKLASERNNGNNEIDGFGINKNDVEYAKKLGKLSKLGKSKSEKMSKSQNLAKSRKKLLKSGNSINCNATEDGPKFLTPNTRTAFNHL